MPVGTLYVVATPIGNLKDITARALETFRVVELILCEDTRQTKKLLNHFAITTSTQSYHQHSSEAIKKKIFSFLQAGKAIALVTDAGTPGISDPGNELIEMVVKRVPEIAIIPIPGPSAVIAALSVCGFPTSSFLFLGFPPHKKGRQKFFAELSKTFYTTVFYESCHRFSRCLSELALVLLPNQKICICRELTKSFENVYRGTIEEIRQLNIPEKGEFVIVVSPTFV